MSADVVAGYPVPVLGPWWAPGSGSAGKCGWRFAHPDRTQAAFFAAQQTDLPGLETRNPSLHQTKGGSG